MTTAFQEDAFQVDQLAFQIEVTVSTEVVPPSGSWRRAHLRKPKKRIIPVRPFLPPEEQAEEIGEFRIPIDDPDAEQEIEEDEKILMALITRVIH